MVKNKKNKSSQPIHQGLIASQYSDPIPHPKIFAQFEEVLPGSADRILKMAESQSSHRQAIENRVVRANNIRSFMGLAFAFILVLAGFYGAYKIIMAGQWVAGLTAGLVPFATIVTIFIQQRRQDSGK